MNKTNVIFYLLALFTLNNTVYATKIGVICSASHIKLKEDYKILDGESVERIKNPDGTYEISIDDVMLYQQKCREISPTYHRYPQPNTNYWWHVFSTDSKKHSGWISSNNILYSASFYHADSHYLLEPTDQSAFTKHYKIVKNKNIFAQKKILDITMIPQNHAALNFNGTGDTVPSFDTYNKSYFLPWNQKTIHHFDAQSLKKRLSKRPTRFSENYSKLPHSFFAQLENNANIQALGSVHQPGIILNNTNLRSLPTNRLLFSDINTAGEGYPFDYAQDDFLRIGEPVLISHYTHDGQYAYVLTSSGTENFVLSESIAPVYTNFMNQYQSNMIMVSQDTLARLDSDQNNAATIQLYIGTYLPTSGDATSVLIPIKNINGQASFYPVDIKQSAYIHTPRSFKKNNVKKLVNHLINQPYGWGGNVFHRDCARLVRDYFAVFGIHMPLLSHDQSQQGTGFDLSMLDRQTKIDAILSHAVPYQSIIYMPGHIGIYLGEYHQQPIILHAIWGLKLFDRQHNEYRYIIGQSIISSLSPGKELLGFSKTKSDLLNRITGFSLLVE